MSVFAAQHAADDRPVNPDQEAVHRVLVLRHDVAAHEQDHQHRHQRDREHRRRRHRESLGVGERREQPAFLRFQREDRQEGHGDDQQGEEQRRADLLAASIRISARGLPGLRRSRCLCAFSIITIARVDHGADGDRDAAEAHDVATRSRAQRMAMNAIRMPTGSMRMATSALRTCSRKTTQTSATMSAFLGSVCLQRADRAHG